MKSSYLALSLIASLLSVGCVSATADVDSVCSSKEMSFPGVPANVSAKVGEKTKSVESVSDMSGALSKVPSFASVRVTSVNLVMDSQSDLTFLHHVKVTIHNGMDTTNELVLSDADFSGLVLPVSVDQDKLLEVLKNGSATMVFTGTGNIPIEATEIKTSFCVGVEAKGSKSL